MPMAKSKYGVLSAALILALTACSASAGDKTSASGDDRPLDQTRGGRLRGSFLGCGIGAGSFMHARGAFVFLADLFDQTAGHQVLEFLVSTQAKHLLAAAHRIANLQVVEHSLEQVIEAKHLVFREDVAELIRDVIGKPA